MRTRKIKIKIRKLIMREIEANARTFTEYMVLSMILLVHSCNR